MPVAATRLETEAKGLKLNKLYSVSDSPADTIIDIAATFGVDSVVLGGTRRATLVNLLKGNVVARVAAGRVEDFDAEKACGAQQTAIVLRVILRGSASPRQVLEFDSFASSSRML